MRLLDHARQPLRERGLRRAIDLRLLVDALAQRGLELLRRAAEGADKVGDDAAVLLQQRQDQMLDADLGRGRVLGQALGGEDRLLCLFGTTGKRSLAPAKRPGSR